MIDAVQNLVIEIRDHYVAQFRAFALGQRASCQQGSAEVKFLLPADTSAYRQLAVVDFVRNDGTPEAILFEPEAVLKFDRLEGQLAKTELIFEDLRWDAVMIHHDILVIDSVIASWFEKWFDPDEVNFDTIAELSGCIHSVYVASQELQIDLGTAPPEALWELLQCLADGNARCILVR